MKLRSPIFRLFILLIAIAGVLVNARAQTASRKNSTNASATSSEPVRYVGNAQINNERADGGLPWAVGVQSYQVLRASRLYSADSDGQGWTFHHAPALAYWKGKFYAEFISSPVQENGLPPM